MQKKIAIDTVKNPNKSLLGGPSPEEAEKILKTKFKYMRKSIPKLNFAKEEVEIDEAVNLKKLRKEYDKNEDKN